MDLCGSRLTSSCLIFIVFLGLNPQENGAKFFGFNKKAEDGPSRAGGLSKKFPESQLNSENRAASKHRG